MADEADKPTPELLTLREVAAMLRVTPATVRSWAARGRIASTRTPSGQWRIDKNEARHVATPVREAA